MKTFKSKLAGLLCLGLCAASAAMRPGLADPPAGAGYVPVMMDEFNGTTLNTNVWGYNYPWGHTHNGRAAMEASQVKLGSGYLDLQAIWQHDPAYLSYTNGTGGYYDNIKGKQEPLDFTSGTVYSKNRWKYGYFEGRFLVPTQPSAWPAFWMLQDGWPPELDVFEFHGSTASENYTYHFTSSGTNTSWGGAVTGLSAGWHVFGVDWAADHLTYYVDGAQVGSLTDATAISQMGPMYMLIDYQIGGWAPDPVTGEYTDTSGNPITGHYEADYVRVWQKGAVPAPNGTYRLTPLNQPTMALDVSSTTNTLGNIVDIAPATYASNQQWTLAQQSDGTYLISAYGGTTSPVKELDYSGGGTNNGDAVQTRAATGGQHQKFYVVGSDNGYRLIPVTAVGKSVIVSGGPTAGASAPAVLWDYSADSNQVFSLDAPTPPALSISAVAAYPVTSTQATITWTTNNSASTAVDYGASATYGSTVTGASSATSHSVILSGLQPSTQYHYRVRSTDTFSQSQASADVTLMTPGAPMPNLALGKPALVRDTASGDVLVTVTVSNVGTGTVSNVLLSSATLGSLASSTSLPVSLGSIAGGGSATTTLRFPTPPTGASVLRLSGGGSGSAAPVNFSGSSRVQVP